jgi:pimeloyl-ACP methyl ester carboxylesterase
MPQGFVPPFPVIKRRLPRALSRRPPAPLPCAVMATAPSDEGNAEVAGAVELAATSFRLKGLLLVDRRFKVPLDYSGILPGEITVFAREVVPAGPNDTRSPLPYLVYFQGGPGFESPRMTEAGEFRKFAREHRLLLLDQRGTGLSTPVSASTVEDFATTEEAVRYLKCFRAPSIVRDAEMIRKTLVGDEGKWSVLGQSFGGFCVLTYMSKFPWSLHRAFLAGGLAPIDVGCSATQVYRRLIPRVMRQMELYYETFPGDEEVMRGLVLHIDSCPGGKVPLASGSVLSVRGLQALGFEGLGFPGSFARLHYLLERAWDQLPVSGERVLSNYFLRTVEKFLAFDTNPLYFLLHEPCYCNGGGEASEWAAERVRAEFPEMDASAAAHSGKRVYLTGEMVFPFMLDEIAALRPLKAVGHGLAKTTDWESLYSEEMLSSCAVPAAAAVYYHDMYVDFDLSMETVAKSNVKPWVTSEFTHAGIREGSDRVIEQLTALVSHKATLES